MIITASVMNELSTIYAVTTSDKLIFNVTALISN